MGHTRALLWLFIIHSFIHYYNFFFPFRLGCNFDTSRAFDLVNHGILFKRLLVSCFPGPRISECWSGGKPHSQTAFPSLMAFSMGVLSPILFTTYIDDILNDLHNVGVRCFFESLFTGALGYADDVVLLPEVPFPAALRMMLRCCKEFANKHSLQYMISTLL